MYITTTDMSLRVSTEHCDVILSEHNGGSAIALQAMDARGGYTQEVFTDQTHFDAVMW